MRVHALLRIFVRRYNRRRADIPGRNRRTGPIVARSSPRNFELVQRRWPNFRKCCRRDGTRKSLEIRAEVHDRLWHRRRRNFS